MHYITKFRQKRKAKIIEILGGKCSRCDSTLQLEIDHIDPATKSFTVSGNNLNKNWETVLLEVKKCQLLCNSCHIEKTSKESKIQRPLKHGTEWMYRKHKCRCNICIKEYALARKSYPSRNKKTGPL